MENLCRVLRHYVPWWLYIGHDRRVWVKFRCERQKLEIDLFNMGSCYFWNKVREENNFFGVWD